MRDKFLIFDVWGDYAHFKKYYTTSSPLTFSIPPRTALIGLVSAILGIEKEKYLEIMKKEKAFLGVRILNPIKKIRIGINFIDTKVGWRPIKREKLTGRTQIKLEFLKDPKFRVYFSHIEESIYEELKNFLKEHKSVYTPYLGISELICDFQFVEESEVIDRVNSKNFVEICTAIPLDEIVEIDLKDGKYFKDRIPTEMLPERVVTEYRDVLYEVEGKKIKCKVKNGIVLKNNDIITLL